MSRKKAQDEIITENGVRKADNTLPVILLVITVFFTSLLFYKPIFEYLRTTSLQYIIYLRNEIANDYLDLFMNRTSDMADKYGIAIAF